MHTQYGQYAQQKRIMTNLHRRNCKLAQFNRILHSRVAIVMRSGNELRWWRKGKILRWRIRNSLWLNSWRRLLIHLGLRSGWLLLI